MTTIPSQLIKSANLSHVNRARLNETIRYNLTTLAGTTHTLVGLAESVTHLLANIAQTASAGEPLQLMHLRSIAAFMSGVKTLANTLPSMQNPKPTLKALASARLAADGYVTGDVAHIAQIGADNTETMAEYEQLVNNYAISVDRARPNGDQLAQTAKKLQQMIDGAMNAVNGSTPQSLAPTGPAASGTVPPTI